MHTQKEIKQSLEFLAVMSGKKSIDDCKTLGKAPKKRVQKEAHEQEAVIQWAKLQEQVWPELKLLFHIPNGGSRNVIEATNLKRQGVKRGVPDLFLPVPKSGTHGIFIEMKSEKGRVSDEQHWYIQQLRLQWYRVEICYSAESAINAIKNYLEGV